ncbi:synaptotagmin-1-like isoform X1 [Gossypium australe]|uniref:Synaptotagmin-1-like isoform X1 n=1 Tax=Gossypium australe TaxID=47621 RepID=A0A5B6VFT0_9ROSI|nr:synaptotagmin-1-like isoform X1 [Gossypium australe]
MGFVGTVLGIFGFGFGITAGLVIGYYFFIYIQPSDVADPEIRPLVEEDQETLQKMLPEIPFWLDWLNKFLEYMWPNLNKAICATVKGIVKPIIDEQIPQYKIDAVEFEALTLGSLPPTFQGMKIYVTEEKELIMEPSIKWAANANVTIAVKAYGLKATAQVVDLQVFALPRITLKPLVPSFPCFANIFVSLMDKPYVDFGLKVVGIDLMSVPILYRFVQEIIKDQVANMYHWPKTLDVQILDPAKAFDRPVGLLHVKVIRALKLKKKDLLGASDPYVKIKLTESKLPSKQTTVKMKNLNPEWNEDFNFTVKDPLTQILKLHVIDWEQIGKHDKMGMNEVPLKDLTPDEPKLMTLELVKKKDTNDAQKDKSRGQLVVELTYKPFKEEELPKSFQQTKTLLVRAPDNTPDGGGMLVVIVHEAEDVEGKHHNNPYVRILFRGEKRKTKKIRKTRDPRWEEEFTFMLDEPPINDKIHLEVYSSSSRIGLRRPKVLFLHHCLHVMYHYLFHANIFAGHSKYDFLDCRNYTYNPTIYVFMEQESLGYIDINLSDVVNNKRINERYHLIDSKNGRIQIELQWRTKD